SADCSAIIALQGAQLLQFTPRNRQPWLYLPATNDFREGVPVEGGIPLCLPWFGRHADPQLPIHGYLRQQLWQLDDVFAAAEGITLQLRYQHLPTAMFPF